LGTPTSATLTNATGLPLTTGVTGTLPTANGGTNLTSFTSGGVVYASSSSALATGSALTFDGSNLGIAATVTGNSFTQYSNSADGGLIGFAGNAKALFGGSPPTSSLGVRGETNIVFGISSTEAMRLTSTSLYTASGINVGIGTSSPQFGVDLRRGSGADAYFLAAGNNNGTTNGILFGQDTSGLSLIYQYGANPITFWTNTSERARFPAAGGFQSKTTISVGDAAPSTSGAGITFPATQSASSNANTLDDYEEGTFTPTVIGTTTAGTASYSYNSGSYTKIGNLVTISFYIAWSSGTGTGDLRIAGLPFTTANSNDIGALTLGYVSNLTLTALNYATSRVAVNSTQIIFEQTPVGGGAVSVIAYDATAELVVSGSYFV